MRSKCPTWITSALCLAALAAGCRQNMHDQARSEPLEPSRFFADGQASRRPPEGTVAQGGLRLDPGYATGVGADGQMLRTLPFPVTRQVLKRGQERYDIFCSPCHDRVGTGRGMIVRRGFTRPTSFHDPRLVGSPVGYYYDVMTRGFGNMPSYAPQVSPADRWAIAAYIRALQLSQNARLSDLPEPLRRQVLAQLAAPADGAPGAPTGGTHR